MSESKAPCMNRHTLKWIKTRAGHMMKYDWYWTQKIYFWYRVGFWEKFKQYNCICSMEEENDILDTI